MFLKDESGATAIEYKLIAAGIAIAIITAVQGVGTKRSSNFSSIQHIIEVKKNPVRGLAFPAGFILQKDCAWGEASAARTIWAKSKRGLKETGREAPDNSSSLGEAKSERVS